MTTPMPLPAGILPISDLLRAPPISVHTDMRIALAWSLFIERGLAAASVLDRLDRPVGTLYRSDLAAVVLDGETTQPGLEDQLRPAPPAGLTRVGELMRPEVYTLALSATSLEARLQLEVTGAAELCIVDHRGVLVGVVNARDLRAHKRRVSGD